MAMRRGTRGAHYTQPTDSRQPTADTQISAGTTALRSTTVTLHFSRGHSNGRMGEGMLGLEGVTGALAFRIAIYADCAMQNAKK